MEEAPRSSSASRVFGSLTIARTFHQSEIFRSPVFLTTRSFAREIMTWQIPNTFFSFARNGSLTRRDRRNRGFLTRAHTKTDSREIVLSF